MSNTKRLIEYIESTQISPEEVARILAFIQATRLFIETTNPEDFTMPESAIQARERVIEFYHALGGTGLDSESTSPSEITKEQ